MDLRFRARHNFLALCLISSLYATSDASHPNKLSDLQTVNPAIKAHMYYATENNFTKKARIP